MFFLNTSVGFLFASIDPCFAWDKGSKTAGPFSQLCERRRVIIVIIRM